MTLTRTIRRREQRKRLKAWLAKPRKPSPFITPDWMVADFARHMTNQLRVVQFFDRKY